MDSAVLRTGIALTAAAACAFSLASCGGTVSAKGYFTPEEVRGGDPCRAPLPASVLVLPHYHPLAGKLLQRGYRASASERITRVILIAPDHFRAGGPVATTTDSSFDTDFGTLEADSECIDALVRRGPVVKKTGPFVREHGILVHAPFIKHYFPRARLVPLILNGLTMEKCAALDDLFDGLPGDGTLVIVSSDLSHYMPYGRAVELDRRSCGIIAGLKMDEILHVVSDCRCGVRMGMRAALRRRAIRGTLLGLVNSAEIVNDPRLSSTTGMAAILFTGLR